MHSDLVIRSGSVVDDQREARVGMRCAVGVLALVVVACGPPVQSNPIAIEEVRRILVEHADQVCRASGAACGPPPRVAPVV